LHRITGLRSRAGRVCIVRLWRLVWELHRRSAPVLHALRLLADVDIRIAQRLLLPRIGLVERSILRSNRCLRVLCRFLVGLKLGLLGLGLLLRLGLGLRLACGRLLRVGDTGYGDEIHSAGRIVSALRVVMSPSLHVRVRIRGVRVEHVRRTLLGRRRLSLVLHGSRRIRVPILLRLNLRLCINRLLLRLRLLRLWLHLRLGLGQGLATTGTMTPRQDLRWLPMRALLEKCLLVIV